MQGVPARVEEMRAAINAMLNNDIDVEKLTDLQHHRLELHAKQFKTAVQELMEEEDEDLRVLYMTNIEAAYARHLRTLMQIAGKPVPRSPNSLTL